MKRGDDDDGARLAEILAGLSLAIDLGLGQPAEHVLRSCLIALRTGEKIDLTDQERAVVYYAALLAWVGCLADSQELADLFGDDIEFRAGTYDVDLAGLPALAFMLRRAGSGGSPFQRVGRAAGVLVSGSRTVTEMMMAHCQVTGTLAERLGLSGRLSEVLKQNFARYDGKGFPAGLGGQDIAVEMRLVHIADVAETFHHRGGVPAAVEVVRERSGTQFDPDLAEIFCSGAPEILADLGDGTSWDAVIDAEPLLRSRLAGEQLDTALEAIADFIDLKTPQLSGHSRGVAALAAEAAHRSGMEPADVTLVRRAGLVHDLGRVGVSNSIWGKPGPLTPEQWERVRLHPYYTERILSRPAFLADLGRVAAMHHERLDGSGYHRGLSAPSIPKTARLLQAADVYHALTEPRPYRDAHTAEAAAGKIRAEVKAGRLDGDSVEAVLGAAGHRVARRRSLPAGLTAREAEILRRLALGRAPKDIAGELHISRKTVSNHIEHIYMKVGATTRTEAVLFAMENGLCDTLAPRP